MAVTILCFFQEFQPMASPRQSHPTDDTGQIDGEGDSGSDSDSGSGSSSGGSSSGSGSGSTSESGGGVVVGGGGGDSREAATVAMGVHHSVEAEACQSGLQLAAVALALAAASVAAVAIAALLAWALRSSCRPFRRRTGSRARELRIGRQGGGGARGREREHRFGGRMGAREKAGLLSSSS